MCEYKSIIDGVLTCSLLLNEAQKFHQRNIFFYLQPY